MFITYTIETERFRNTNSHILDTNCYNTKLE